MGLLSKKERKIAAEHMERLGVAHLCRHCFTELSGGQRQRVLMARALCAAQKVLLLDEPAANLDPVIIRELYDLIRHVNRSTGLTIIMASHDLKNAIGQASHILHLHKMQVFYGETADYMESETGIFYLQND
jgi:zinc transport system ATP-binding protein